MEISTLLAFLQLYAAAIIIGVGLLAVVVFLSTKNRLLFLSLSGAVALHILLILGVWVAGNMIKEKNIAKIPPYIDVTILPPDKIEKTPPEKDKKQEKDNLDKPLGTINPKKNNHKKEQTKKSSEPPPLERNKRTIFSENDSIDSDFAAKYQNEISNNENDNLNTNDIDKDIPLTRNRGEDGDGDGEEGDDGESSGFPNGTAGGKVYFITLKWGNANSGWCSNSEGLNRLLKFLDEQVPCQEKVWARSSSDIRKKYLMKNLVPSFIYIFCDETFSLSSVDAVVLRDYIGKGGFLFIDSRDESIKDKVSSELGKVVSGKLSPISGNNPINTFLYRLNQPGVGLNPAAKNYGITRGGRLVVFYTPGNLSYVYANYKAEDDEYFKAQYQMGTNVIMYAIQKGDSNGITKQAGAKISLTQTVIDKITGNNKTSVPTVEKDKSVKLKNNNTGYGAFTEPEEIEIE